MAIIEGLIDPVAFDAWAKTRPDDIQAMIQSHPPDRLYQLLETEYRVTIQGYHEDGVVAVEISERYNLTPVNRRILGVPLDCLAECDLPGPDVPVGIVDTAVDTAVPYDPPDAISPYTTIQDRSYV